MRIRQTVFLLMLLLADIRRPRLLRISEESPRVEVCAPKYIYDGQTGLLQDIYIAPALVKKKGTGFVETSSLPEAAEDFVAATFKKFNALTYRLGKMVRLAELHMDALRNVIDLYLQRNDVAAIAGRKAACRFLLEANLPEELNQLSFEALRGVLSCLVKTDKTLQQLPGLQTNEERRNFTKVYHNYIEDRNRYTHGLLFFLYPGLEPVLRVRTHAGVAAYMTFDEGVFTDNLLTYDYLTQTLSAIREGLLK